MSYGNLKQERPIRFMIAVVVFRSIWWPVLVTFVPFAMIGVFVDWLSWTAFPAVARAFQPIGGASHSVALRVADAILGHKQEPPQ